MKNKIWLVGTVVILLGAIVGVSLIRYQPALASAPGHNLWFVTQPSPLAHVPRIIEQVSERQPCEYEILGWTDNRTLYYKANCAGEVEIRRYTTNSLTSTEATPVLPNTLQTTVISKQEVLNSVRAAGVRPKKYESVTRPLLLASAGYVSPTGKQVALVTQHLYGPQDVIIVDNVSEDGS